MNYEELLDSALVRLPTRPRLPVVSTEASRMVVYNACLTGLMQGFISFDPVGEMMYVLASLAFANTGSGWWVAWNAVGTDYEDVCTALNIDYWHPQVGTIVMCEKEVLKIFPGISLPISHFTLDNEEQWTVVMMTTIGEDEPWDPSNIRHIFRDSTGPDKSASTYMWFTLSLRHGHRLDCSRLKSSEASS